MKGVATAPADLTRGTGRGRLHRAAGPPHPRAPWPGAVCTTPWRQSAALRLLNRENRLTFAPPFC
ncbi:MAG: hypothetical protein CVT82_11165 [Alphaproteobacteria bacterium HGW-Alphaproteobacteria-4]|nr:MAG: hypothetical protein CVT82_11165 [Alphaproteobacteria bacterium HGW-Alphaproteobacteria-4]